MDEQLAKLNRIHAQLRQHQITLNTCSALLLAIAVMLGVGLWRFW